MLAQLDILGVGAPDLLAVTADEFAAAPALAAVGIPAAAGAAAAGVRAPVVAAAATAATLVAVPPCSSRY